MLTPLVSDITSTPTASAPLDMSATAASPFIALRLWDMRRSTTAAITTTGTATGTAEGAVKTIGILDYAREPVGSAVARDSNYLKSFLDEQGPCTVHTSAPEPVEPYDPYAFNRYDPDTWPTAEQWPGFDPADETTWPDYNLPPLVTPTPGGETTPPVTETTPPPSPTPDPASTPAATPPAEPFVPAGG